MDLTSLPIEKLAPMIRARKLSPREITDAFLKRIAKLNPKLNAYITVAAKRAREDARCAEREIRSGNYRGPLHGIPICLKDNIETAGVRTTGGSKILRDSIPQTDSLIAAQLRDAGCVLLGKTNLHEFAYGVTTENPHFAPTRNPWNAKLIPGGSSGGNAAAIAAGMACAAIGTDTGGSVRIPSAHCGIVGLKTTYDRAALAGIIPLSESLDSVGPMARTVKDAAMLIRCTAPYANQDAQALRERMRGCLPPPQAAKRTGAKPLRGIVFGIPQDYFNLWIDVQVRRAVEAAIEDCRLLGARVREIEMPWIAESDDAGTQIALAEASAWHMAQGWFPQRAEDYGEDVRKRLEMGAGITAMDYLAAKQKQKALLAKADEVFRSVHALAVATVPVAATPIGEHLTRICGRPEPVRAALLRLNRPANFLGCPAISVPCGFSKQGLPIGLQLIGPPYSELNLCSIARPYEQAHDWHTRRPVVS